jgi:transposase
VAGLAALLEQARARAGRGGGAVRVVSCYEAGYDGHWLDRWLANHGVVNRVIDPASLEVNRKARRAKTDRIDLDRLMRALMAHRRGEPLAASMVRVPDVAAEDRKRLTRERERLLRERTQHSNRIKGLLHGQGIRDAKPRKPGFVDGLDAVSTGDGRPLPPHLKAEIIREHARLELVCRQIADVEAYNERELKAAAPGSAEAKAARLGQLKGIGRIGAQELVNEVFYRDFANRREVASYVGLTATPFMSGSIAREQGIAKAGNRRARQLAVELAWLWLRHQEASQLSAWFRARVGAAQAKLIKKVAIVALARKLVVALWRYVETGLIPEGAVLKTRP